MKKEIRKILDTFSHGSLSWLSERSAFQNQILAQMKSDQMSSTSPKLILISQVQRSGGTLLSQLFDSHPNSWAYPWELVWGKIAWPQDLIFEKSGSEAFDFLFQSSDTFFQKSIFYGYHKKPVETTELGAPFVFSPVMMKSIFTDFFSSDPPKTNRQVFDIYFKSFFLTWLNYLNRTIDKVEYVTAFAPRVNMISDHPGNELFFRDYPDGYMICSIREPLNWYTSASKHARTYKDILHALEIWRRSTEDSISLREKYPGKVKIIFFEHLVSNPSAVIKEICSFTNLNFDQSLLRPTFNGAPLESNSQYSKVSGFIDSSVASRGEESLAELTEDQRYLLGENQEFYRTAILAESVSNADSVK